MVKLQAWLSVWDTKTGLFVFWITRRASYKRDQRQPSAKKSVFKLLLRSGVGMVASSGGTGTHTTKMTIATLLLQRTQCCNGAGGHWSPLPPPHARRTSTHTTVWRCVATYYKKVSLYSKFCTHLLIWLSYKSTQFPMSRQVQINRSRLYPLFYETPVYRGCDF